ncbi:alpha/beta hydrolase [Leifsonia poae]|uniref:alpha/beta hydrolase n=1 Tax=Leifsonia poae TaxID=110933 RepID=UPI003D66A76C
MIDPTLREATLKLKSPDVSSRPLMAIVRVATKLLKPVQTPGVTISTVRSGSLRLRIYTPDRVLSDGGLLWIHGGGMVMGVAKQDDPLCGSVASELGTIVVSAEYSLAPRQTFPTALNELAESWRWFQEHASGLGVDPARIVVGGESAGGGLAASLVQRLHDEGGVQPIAQWLFSPMLDDRTAADRDLDSVDHWIWNNAANRVGWSSYLGHEPGQASEPPYAVPARRADLTGLPPTWISVSDIELFADENRAYADRLRASGVDVTVDLIRGAPHGFENYARESAPARALLSRARAWLAARLAMAELRDDETDHADEPA